MRIPRFKTARYKTTRYFELVVDDLEITIPESRLYRVPAENRIYRVRV
jgi:hypothetical protein